MSSSIQCVERHAVTADQAKVTAEVAQLTAELVRIRDSSTFNGIALFGAAGAGTTVTIQVGANQNIDSANNTNRVGVTLAALSFSARLDGRVADRHRDQLRLVGPLDPRCRAEPARARGRQPRRQPGEPGASESRIRDVDVASEMVNFTRLQILSQSGTAMLAQANQAPQGVLSLLR